MASGNSPGPHSGAEAPAPAPRRPMPATAVRLTTSISRCSRRAPAPRRHCCPPALIRIQQHDSPPQKTVASSGRSPDTRRYHARKGFDEFYGYGRLNADKAVAAAANGTIPPEADITSPDWFQQVEPQLASDPGRPATSMPVWCLHVSRPGGPRRPAQQWPGQRQPPGGLRQREPRPTVTEPRCTRLPSRAPWRGSGHPRSRPSSPATFRALTVMRTAGWPRRQTAARTRCRSPSRSGWWSGRPRGSGRPAMTGEDRRQLSCTATGTCCPVGPRSSSQTATHRPS